MSAFAQWLVTFVRNVLTWLYNNTIDLLQALFDGFIDFSITVVSLFPDSVSVPDAPSTPVSQVFDFFITALNWVFPVAYIVSVAGFLVAGMLAYFLIAPLARWVKLLT